MKQFKNNNFVVHSNSIPLLNAFYQLALEMGRKDDVLWNKSRKVNYTYLWFSDDFDMQFHNHNCSDATRELYNLPQDWDKALALASEVVEPEIIKDTPKPVTYKRGDRFIREGREYILARESANYRSLILVCLDDGNIWSDAVRVDDPEKVTEAEFKKLCSSGKFKLVKK